MNLHPKLVSNSWASLPKGLDALDITQGPLVIFSTPPVMYKSPSPSFIALAAFIVAAIPEEHNLFTVSPPMVNGRSASNTAILATFRLSSPA